MDENGIFLNGNLIGTEPVPFTDSSTLQCGDQEFRVKLVQANANCPPELSLISSAVHIDLPIVQGKRPWGTALKKAVEAYEKGLSAVVREGRITELEVSDLNRVHARLGLLD